VDDFEAGGVEDRAFESGVLIAADDQGVESGGLHPGTDVFVTAIDLFRTWQSDLGG
jgi:hypothetical protein